jgi:hypothetical protein
MSKAGDDKGVLYLWTVYDHPLDFPHAFVARRFAVERGTSRATSIVLTAESLTAIRAEMLSRGLHRIARAPSDDAKIVETWL